MISTFSNKIWFSKFISAALSSAGRMLPSCSTTRTWTRRWPRWKGLVFLTRDTLFDPWCYNSITNCDILQNGILFSLNQHMCQFPISTYNIIDKLTMSSGWDLPLHFKIVRPRGNLWWFGGKISRGSQGNQSGRSRRRGCLHGGLEQQTAPRESQELHGLRGGRRRPGK